MSEFQMAARIQEVMVKMVMKAMMGAVMGAVMKVVMKAVMGEDSRVEELFAPEEEQGENVSDAGGEAGSHSGNAEEDPTDERTQWPGRNLTKIHRAHAPANLLALLEKNGEAHKAYSALLCKRCRAKNTAAKLEEVQREMHVELAKAWEIYDKIARRTGSSTLWPQPG